MKKTATTENMEKCSQFAYCSANVCLLDPEAQLKKRLAGEEQCPFTINKKSNFQKNMKTLMPLDLLKLVPESNVKLLNRRNKKRWLMKGKS